MKKECAIKDYGITDFGTWLHDYGDRVYRIFRRDDPEGNCSYAKIHKAIEIPNDILLELEYDPWSNKKGEYREFEPLSKLMLAYSDGDQEFD